MTDIWLYAGLSLFLLVGVATLSAKVRGAKRTGSANPADYERVEQLMSPAERSLFEVLKQISGEEFEIFGKVRMADVIAPRSELDRSSHRTASNRIASKHFDYVVCAADDLRILCAVALDDRSHERRDRRERDFFVDTVCAAIGLPLVRVQAAAQYSPAAISAQIGAAIRGHDVQAH